MYARSRTRGAACVWRERRLDSWGAVRKCAAAGHTGPNAMWSRALDRATRGQPLSEAEALALVDAELDAGLLGALMEAAAEARERAFGRRVTFSPKVFLPLTNLCRNRC